MSEILVLTCLLVSLQMLLVQVNRKLSMTQQTMNKESRKLQGRKRKEKMWRNCLQLGKANRKLLFFFFWGQENLIWKLLCLEKMSIDEEEFET